MRRGSRPTLSTLMTTAGRTLRISAPTAGSKSISHTSPRFGAGAFAMQVVLAESLEGGQFRPTAVFLFGLGGGGLQDGVALPGRQLAQLGGRPALAGGG